MGLILGSKASYNRKRKHSLFEYRVEIKYFSMLKLGVLFSFFIIHCSEKPTPELPNYLPSESEIKYILKNDTFRAQLETSVRNHGKSSLKEWKNELAQEISENEIDQLQAIEKFQGSSYLNQDSDFLRIRNDLKNRLAWYRLFQQEGILIPKKITSTDKLPSLEKKFVHLPSRGNSKARLVVYEFSDYTCPYCRKSHIVTQSIFLKYKDRIRWVFVDFPLTDLPFDESPAQLLGNCIQDKKSLLFWQFYDLVFITKGMTSEQTVAALAQSKFGFTEKSWRDCKLGLGEYSVSLVELNSKKNFAESLGINATPSFMIGRKMIQGFLSFEKFEKILLKELNSF